MVGARHAVPEVMPASPTSDLADTLRFRQHRNPDGVYLLTCASGPGVEGAQDGNWREPNSPRTNGDQWPAADSGLVSLATLVYNFRETVGVAGSPPCGIHEGCHPAEEVH